MREAQALTEREREGRQGQLEELHRSQFAINIVTMLPLPLPLPLALALALPLALALALAFA